MKANLDVKNVHVIFKTHLDLGFTDFAANVLRLYVEDFIPRALRLAKESRQQQPDERFVWTTGSWLLYQFLERADREDRSAMESAIAAGDIAWHALPFTTHTELLDASLFRFGLSLSKELDSRFDRKTIAAKMTDVPGHSRSMVPLLAQAGVKFLHIGVNPACTAPDVPPIFRWQEPCGDEIVVMYQRDYGQVDLLQDGTTAVALSFTGDNHGPPTLETIVEVYRTLALRFPSAKIFASTLDNVGAVAWRLRQTLPIVTSEVGDTWIHGAGADPTKMRQFRELTRLRSEWLKSGAMDPSSRLHRSFSLPLLTVAEHTWGMDEKTHLGDYESYLPEAFHAMQTQESCLKFEASWKEQRAYIDEAVAALECNSLADQAVSRLQASEPFVEDLTGYRKLDDASEKIETAHFTIGFGPDGSINFLRERASGRLWSNTNHPFGGLSYEAFSSDDYARFFDRYATQKPDWAIKDLTKPGMEVARRQHCQWRPSLTSVYVDEDGERFVAEISMPKEAPCGCPSRIAFSVYAPVDEPTLLLNVQWFDKPASRLPEAVWFDFAPCGVAAAGWSLEKMGREVSPLDVVRNGNRRLHAIDRYVRYADRDGGFVLESLDSPLVAPGAPSLLDFNNRRPPLRQGMHFNLYNNVWGTNFPMWFSDNARFRFRIAFGSLALAVGGEQVSAQAPETGEE